MSRLVAALLASLVSTSLAVAAELPPRVVDLNEPGVLEALRASNPAHYGKIRTILDDVLEHADTAVPRWIQTVFDARDVRYVPIVLTTHPPKRQLSFTLDATRYDVAIVLTNVRGAVVPAK
jgi:hypothetical protein